MSTNRRQFLSGAVGGLVAAGAAGGPRRAWAQGAAKIKPGGRDVLLVVDVQNDFIPGGALAVKEGDVIVPLVNQIAAGFEHVIMTQDWHTPGHASFASSYPGKRPFETTELAYGTQVLWPDHCVQGTADADLHKDLKLPTAQIIIRKGFHQEMDSYSAIEEADHKTATGLAGYLKQRGIKTLYVTGLATDFCVAWTAMDARKAGFEVYVIEDATRAIDLNGSLAAAWKQMTAKGVKRIQASDIA
jgi:nicotinamidase/pyrazinamidase